jgi:hypothetical protein
MPGRSDCSFGLIRSITYSMRRPSKSKLGVMAGMFFFWGGLWSAIIAFPTDHFYLRTILGIGVAVFGWGITFPEDKNTN